LFCEITINYYEAGQAVSGTFRYYHEGKSAVPGTFRYYHEGKQAVSGTFRYYHEAEQAVPDTLYGRKYNSRSKLSYVVGNMAFRARGISTLARKKTGIFYTPSCL
jgi:hypothetical protein